VSKWNEPNAALPAGKTCGDCVWFRRCQWLFQCKQYATECDFLPVKFRQAESKEDGNHE
jgi:hypothetical protein